MFVKRLISSISILFFIWLTIFVLQLVLRVSGYIYDSAGAL